MITYTLSKSDPQENILTYFDKESLNRYIGYFEIKLYLLNSVLS